MPIFDDVRGLVPLPRSVDRSRDTSVETSLPEGFIGSGSQDDYVNLANSLADQVYSQINEVYGWLQLPTPAVITDLYKDIQGVEAVIDDPIGFLKKKGKEKLYDILHPQKRTLVDGKFPLPNPTKNAEGEEISSVGTDFKAKERSNKLSMTGVSGVVQEYDRAFKGRDSIRGLTLRSTDLWDLKMEPFHYKTPNSNKWVPNILPSDKKVEGTSHLSDGAKRAVQLTNSTDSNSNYFSPFKIDYLQLGDTPPLTDYIPVLSYDVDLKTLTTKSIDLFGGSTIQVPDIIRYSSSLTLQIVDDELKRWRRWFQEYSENLYDEDTNSVAPYKNSALAITIIQYRQDFKVLSYNKYICTLGNYQMISQGTGQGGGTDTIDVEFSIVGKEELDQDYQYVHIV